MKPAREARKGEALSELVDELHEILAIRDMPLYPDAAEKAGVCYTDFLTRAHPHKFATDPKTGENYVYTPHRNRQRSIGFHAECTDPDGESCGCPCHQIAKLLERAMKSPPKPLRSTKRKRK